MTTGITCYLYSYFHTDGNIQKKNKYSKLINEWFLIAHLKDRMVDSCCLSAPPTRSDGFEEGMNCSSTGLLICMKAQINSVKYMEGE